MSTRGYLIVATLGAAIGYIGWEEATLGSGASADPTPVELAELEGGRVPDNAHLKIGQHTALYQGSVFEFKADFWRDEPRPEDEINHTYYPIVSRIPEDGSIPNVAVLVRTDEFPTVGDLPMMNLDRESLQGMVVNRVKKLDDEEARLIRESFPTVDIEKVLIVEPGRTPTSSAMAYTLLALGPGIALLCLLGIIRTNRKPVSVELASA